MTDFLSQKFLEKWKAKGISLTYYLLSKWYLTITFTLICGAYGFYKASQTPPTYNATISFVLSTTDQRISSGLSGLAAQLGIDASTSGGENIFTGDNIVELFKSQKIVRQALLKKIPEKGQSLLNFIASNQFPEKKNLLPFPADPLKFTNDQTKLFRFIANSIANSFTIFKKDKRLVFYYISATASSSDIAYYTAKTMLVQAAEYFIETKTKTAVQSLNLLRREADSIENVLGGTYRSSLNAADQSFNLNPSITVQRYGTQYNIAKATALAAAYTEVMRNLEIAKINVQKETPLYRVIDEPDLPIPPQRVSKVKEAMFSAIVGLLISSIALSAFWLIKNLRS